MNRTTTFLVIAAALGLVALVVKLPATEAKPPPIPEPVVVVKEVPVPVQPAPTPEPVAAPGSLTLTGKLSHPYVTPGLSDVFLSFDVTAIEVPGMKRSPVNLSLVIDRSGSMNGEKIAHARQAALALVDQLDEHDRLAIVHYGNDVVTFPGSFVTEDNKKRMKAFIRRIQDEGGTNIGDGLMAGKAQLDKGRSDFTVNRLILLSDGQPTVGVTSASGLTKMATRIHSDGTTLTSIGVGLDFNEDLMQRMAEVGGGSYAFLQNSSAIAGIFQRDLKQAGAQVARDVALRLTLPPGVTFGEVMGRPATASGNVVTVALPDFSAGQIEKLVVRVRVQAPGLANQALDVTDSKLTYTDVLAGRAADQSVKLAALVTADATLALAKRDKAAVVAATRAQSAVNYKKAAEWLERGEQKRAQDELRKNDVLFEEAAPLAGAELEKDRADNKQFFGLTSSPAAAMPEGRAMGTKAMKVQSLRSSGYGDSVY